MGGDTLLRTLFHSSVSESMLFIIHEIESDLMWNDTQCTRFYHRKNTTGCILFKVKSTTVLQLTSWGASFGYGLILPVYPGGPARLQAITPYECFHINKTHHAMDVRLTRTSYPQTDPL